MNNSNLYNVSKSFANAIIRIEYLLSLLMCLMIAKLQTIFKNQNQNVII